MIRALLLLGHLWSVCPSVMSIADDLIDSSLWTTPPGPALPSVAGIPYADALMIVERHRKELERFPEVRGIELTAEGIVVYTDFPEALPREIEGIPVTSRPLTSISPLPPSGDAGGEASPSASHPEELPHSLVSPAQELPLVAGISYDMAWAIVDRHREELMQTPEVYSVALGEQGILVQVLVYTSNRVVDSQDAALLKARAALPTELEGLPVQVLPRPVLPPPRGVIVLGLDGKQKHADKCPKELREELEKGWHFCVDPLHPEPIPLIMEPPIAGVPYEDALAIVDRNSQKLSRIPGVTSVGLGEEGVIIGTDQPDLLPSEVEGLPVKVILSQGSARAR